MSQNIVKLLEKFFVNQCDGDWEHSCGVKIETLDNPGWHVEIDLPLDRRNADHLLEKKIESSDLNWIVCHIEEDTFHGYGGPENLGDILEIFMAWINETSESV